MGDTFAADLELEQLEEEDIMDFLQSKGTALDAFRKEFTEMQKVSCKFLFTGQFQFYRASINS